MRDNTNEIYCKLQEAEFEAEATKERFSSEDILRDMKTTIERKMS